MLDFTKQPQENAAFLISRYGFEKARAVVDAQISWMRFCYSYDAESLLPGRWVYMMEVHSAVCAA